MGEPQNFKIHLSRTTTLTSLFTTSLHFLPPTLKLGGWIAHTRWKVESAHAFLSIPYSLQAFTLLRMASPAQTKVSVLWAWGRLVFRQGTKCLPQQQELCLFISSRCKRTRPHQSWQPWAANEWSEFGLHKIPVYPLTNFWQPPTSYSRAGDKLKNKVKPKWYAWGWGVLPTSLQ